MAPSDFSSPFNDAIIAATSTPPEEPEHSPFSVFDIFPSVNSTLNSSYCRQPVVTLFFSIVTHEFDNGSFPLNDKPICVFK